MNWKRPLTASAPVHWQKQKQILSGGTYHHPTATKSHKWYSKENECGNHQCYHQIFLSLCLSGTWQECTSLSPWKLGMTKGLLWLIAHKCVYKPICNLPLFLHPPKQICGSTSRVGATVNLGSCISRAS